MNHWSQETPPGGPLFANEAIGDDGVARALREHYTKSEHRVPMRDGTRLFTIVYAPRERGRTFPFLLLRSPFGVGPYGPEVYPTPDNTQARLAPLAGHVQDGFIFVFQDVRGRMMSEGEFVNMRPYIAKKTGTEYDESSDAHDTIEWLLHAIEGHNGRVGVWGLSYPGFYAAQAGIDAHPALAAISPQAPPTDWFIGDDLHRHGALCLADAFGFSASLAQTARDAQEMTWAFDHDGEDPYDFFLRLGPLGNADPRHFQGANTLWNALMTHGTRDAFWQSRDPREHYRGIAPAVLVTGGWFDEADLFGTLATYDSMRGKDARHLAMGPWNHGGWMESDGERLGALDFGSRTAITYRRRVELPFFRHYLKGADERPPAVFVFETGTNIWRSEERWPPAATSSMTLWLHADEGLRAAPPTGESNTSWDVYTSDPDQPVPHRDRVSAGGDDGEYMIADQRYAAERADVLVYQTDILEEALTLAGPVDAYLWVSTTGTDADFIVKLVDVHPGCATQQLVRAEVMRARFRNSYESPEPLEPGVPTRIRVPLLDVSHTFHGGHRLMVQIQSSWFPQVDRNPQTFVDIYTADASEFRAATHRIHRSAKLPSRITATVRTNGAGAGGAALD